MTASPAAFPAHCRSSHALTSFQPAGIRHLTALPDRYEFTAAEGGAADAIVGVSVAESSGGYRRPVYAGSRIRALSAFAYSSNKILIKSLIILVLLLLL
jgi:hypothetical protein